MAHRRGEGRDSIMSDDKDPSAGPNAYAPGKLHLLKGMEPVRERGPTILNGAHLSDEELRQLCAVLAGNKHLWQIEVLDASLRKTVIFRGQMPPDKLLP
jgi:hypothetical protein